MSDQWEVDQEKTKDHWLEVVEKQEDGPVYRRAVAKWDGCVHYYRFYNGGEGVDDEGADYIHICNIDEEIDRLQRLKEMAKVHFKNHHYAPDKPFGE